MYDVVTVGSATRDLIIRTRAGKVIATPEDPRLQKVLGFEYGAKILVEQTYDHFGGGGCNVAIALASLGLKVAARVHLGKDMEGIRIKKRLAVAKVSTKLITWDLRLRTDLSVVIIDEKGEGDHFIFVDKNASDQISLGPKRFKTKWLYISSLTGQWQKLLADAVAVSREKGVKLALNPGSLQLKSGYRGLKEVLACVSLIILSLDEAIELVLSKGNQAGLAPEALCREIVSWGPKICVITQGAQGAVAYDGKTLKHEPGIVVAKPVDTTGAGDAFSAGFIGALVLGQGLEKALVWGVKNGASVIQQYGAQEGLLSRKDLEK